MYAAARPSAQLPGPLVRHRRSRACLTPLSSLAHAGLPEPDGDAAPTIEGSADGDSIEPPAGRRSERAAAAKAAQTNSHAAEEEEGEPAENKKRKRSTSKSCAAADAGDGDKKERVRRDEWTSDEDEELRRLVGVHGIPRWSLIGQDMETRFGALPGAGRWNTRCRDRWVNYLSPDIDRSEFTVEEELRVVSEVLARGTAWSAISKECMPKRPANDIKNRFVVLIGKERSPDGSEWTAEEAELRHTFLTNRSIILTPELQVALAKHAAGIVVQLQPTPSLMRSRQRPGCVPVRMKTTTHDDAKAAAAAGVLVHFKPSTIEEARPLRRRPESRSASPPDVVAREGKGGGGGWDQKRHPSTSSLDDATAAAAVAGVSSVYLRTASLDDATAAAAVAGISVYLQTRSLEDAEAAASTFGIGVRLVTSNLAEAEAAAAKDGIGSVAFVTRNLKEAISAAAAGTAGFVRFEAKNIADAMKAAAARGMGSVHLTASTLADAEAAEEAGLGVNLVTSNVDDVIAARRRNAISARLNMFSLNVEI